MAGRSNSLSPDFCIMVSKMLARDVRFDIIRAVGVLMILVCHLLSHYGSCGAEAGHDILAQVGNCIFYVMSGWLLGQSWIARGTPNEGWAFFARRVKKLGLPFLIFIVPYMIALKAVGFNLPQKTIMANCLMLSWFAKLPAAGHLWFVTAILIFYAVAVGLMRMGGLARRHGIFMCFSILVAALVGQGILWICGIRQGYLLTFLFGASCLFLFGDRFLVFLKVHSQGCLVASISLSVIGSGFLGWWLPREWVIVRTWVALATSIALMGGIIVVAKEIRKCTVVSAFAGIGFEIYLVHCVFLEDVLFPWQRWLSNTTAFALNYFVASFIAAWLLSVGCKWIKGMIISERMKG